MDAKNLMEEWEVSPFDGGFEGLAALQARRFSGAVEAGGAWLFLRDGEPVAVVDDLDVDPRPGDVDAFDGASGQLHEASEPTSATLAAMLALGGEVRGQYFTEDTPLSRVHETLSEGGFTGYVELSENILSGDYYVVYEDGEEDYLGAIGSSQRLITDEEAQSKAEGEVGIYNVVAVSLPDVVIPTADSPTAGASSPEGPSGSTGVAGTDEGTDHPGATDDGPADETPVDGSNRETEAGTAVDPDDGTGGAGGVGAPTGTDPDPHAGTDAVRDPESEPSSGQNTGSEADAEAAETGEGGIEIDPTRGDEPGAESGPGAGEGTSVSEPDPAEDTGGTPEPNADPGPDLEDSSVPEDGSGPAAEPEPRGADASSERAPRTTGDPVLEGVTTRSVPSLDPEHSGRAEPSQPTTGGQEAAPGEPGDRDPAATAEPAPEPAPDRPEPGRESGSEPEADPTPEAHPEPEADHRGEEDGSSDERVRAVREEYEARIDDLESDVASLRAERDRLQERVSELQAGNAGADATGASGGEALSAAEALAGTSLFVREGTRGDATLEDAHAGRTDRETLAGNLRIEYHTRFEDAGATVDGEPFETWLRAAAPYDFVEWLITDLLFEIQSTGAASALRPLYDAIPEIDRVGLQDPITVGEGEDAREVSFDVVARNQMGEPLVAATIDEGREPTRAESLRPLIADAEDVVLEHDSLVATFSVTSSYFDPDALDAAREATSGSLLGREKYRSYVKLARKRGFHLCLVESREDSFHLAVPEL